MSQDKNFRSSVEVAQKRNRVKDNGRYRENSRQASTRDLPPLTDLDKPQILSNWHIFDTVPMPILICEPTGNLLKANLAARRLFGWKDAAAPKAFNIFQAGLFPAEVQRKIEAGAALETMLVLDFDLLKSTGILPQTEHVSKKYLAAVLIPIRESGSGNQALILQFIDITGNKQLEQVLDFGERQFKSMVENSPLGIVVADHRARFVYVNPELCRITGYSSEELVGKTFDIVLAPESREMVYDFYKRRQQGENVPSAYLFQIVRKDGRKRTLRMYASTFAGMDGHPMTIAQVMDVTEQLEMEKRLNLLATIVEQAGTGIVETDRDGKIEYVNAGFEKMTGYRAEEVIGQTPGILKSGEHDQKFYEEFWNTILQGKVWQGTFINRRRNGEHYFEDNVVFPIFDEQGEIVHFAAHKQDATERKELEKQFQQAQKMEAIGKLASGVAHDFNNLLTVITGYSQFLLTDLDEESPFYEDIKEIHNAALRGSQLTNQLLAFSRKQVQKLEILDLCDEIAALEKMLRRLLGEDVLLHTYYKSENCLVRADRTQIQQVVMNMVVNARDAMPEGGELVIEVESVHLDDTYLNRHPGTKPGNYVRLCISDNGIGMDQETLDRIFEPFFTTKEPGKGTGLGLSTVYGIVHQSNGHIDVYSEPGQGTTFKIYFPLIENEQKKTDLMPSSGTAAAGEIEATILIVEDEDSLRVMTGRTLRDSGYTVLEAANAGEAFLLFEKYGTEIDLVISDLVMPFMNGKELITRLKMINPAICVIYMSGYTEDAILQFGVLQEGVAFLQKPFSVGELLKTVAEVLKKTED